MIGSSPSNYAVQFVMIMTIIFTYFLCICKTSARTFYFPSTNIYQWIHVIKWVNRLLTHFMHFFFFQRYIIYQSHPCILYLYNIYTINIKMITIDNKRAASTTVLMLCECKAGVSTRPFCTDFIVSTILKANFNCIFPKE